VEAFRSPDPARDGRTITVVELLDRAVGRLDGDFADDPATKGRLLDALGETYQSLGLLAKTVEVHERALAVRQAHLGPDHLLTLHSMNNLALSYQYAGRP